MHLLLATLLLASAPQPRTRLAVLPISHTDLTPELVPTLTAVVSVELERTGLFEVISPRDIGALVDLERERDKLGCDDVACFIELGGALGVDRVLSTHVGRLGSQYVIDMAIINTLNQRSEGRAYERVPQSEEQLVEALRRSTQKLAAASRVVASSPEKLQVQAPLPSGLRRAGWWAAATGSALLIAGIVTHNTGHGDVRELLGTGMLVAGGATALAGLWTVGLTGSDSEVQLSLAPLLVPGGAGLALRGGL